MNFSIDIHWTNKKDTVYFLSQKPIHNARSRRQKLSLKYLLDCLGELVLILEIIGLNQNIVFILDFLVLQ